LRLYRLRDGSICAAETAKKGTIRRLSGSTLRLDVRAPGATRGSFGAAPVEDPQHVSLTYETAMKKFFTNA